MLKKTNIIAELRSYIFITFGLFLFAFAWTAFIIPKQITGGGVIGLSSVIFYGTQFPVSYSYLIINAFLLVIGSMILGRGFGLKTLFGIGMSALLFELLPTFIPWTTEINDNLLNAIIGGTISGVGTGMVFMHGGSTGGTDIVALILSKFYNTSPGRVFLYCDLIIIGSIYFLPGRTLENVIYGYVEMVAFSYVIDLVISGNKQSVQIMVFSKNYDIIAERISNELHRGVTALDAMGWYTKEEGKVLVIIVRKSESNLFYKIIKETDNKAFISVANVMGVYGQGFEQIKTGKPKWGMGKKLLAKMRS